MRFPQLTEAGRKRLVVGSIATGATLVVLTGTIFISSALSSPKGSADAPKPAITAEQSDPQQTAADAYQQALDAYRSGDATAAAAILNEALAQNPNDSQARTLLEEITKSTQKSNGSSGSSGSNSSSSTNAAADTKYDKPVKDIGALLPTTVTGFAVGTAVVMEGDASVGADPLDHTTQARLTHVLFAVHDLGSKKAASDFVSKVSKQVYPKGAASVKVGGFPAYFGGDGRNKATLAYARGRYVFETIISTTSQDPASLKDVATSVSAAYRD